MRQTEQYGWVSGGIEVGGAAWGPSAIEGKSTGYKPAAVGGYTSAVPR